MIEGEGATAVPIGKALQIKHFVSQLADEPGENCWFAAGTRQKLPGFRRA